MGPRLSAAPPAPFYRLLGLPRFVLALLVLVWHALPVAGWNTPETYATDFGPVAVFVFFAISGYVIAEAAAAFYAGRPFAFLGNRLLRLWPAYLVALAAMALALLLTGWAKQGELSAANLLANAVALFPTVVITDPLLGLAHRAELLPSVWALRVEFVFYLVVAAALLAGRFGGRGSWLAPLCWLLLAGSLVLYHLGVGVPRATFYFGMAPYFLLGALWALRARLPRLQVRLLLSLSLLLAVLHAYSFDAFDADSSGWDRVPAGWGPFAAAALFVLLLAWCWSRLRRSDAAKPERRAKDLLLGNLTYELYLLHLPAIVLVAWIWPAPDWSSLLVVLALSLTAAALLAIVLGGALRPLRRRLRRAAAPTLG